MKLCSSAQMKELDTRAINEADIPSEVLMTNAARHIAALAEKQLSSGGRVIIFCGTGNNGGDGIAAGAELVCRGVPVRAFLVGDRRISGDPAEMERRLVSAGGRLEPFDDAFVIRPDDVVIDAIFGIGLNRPVSGSALSAIRLINGSEAFVIAADIPSGVSADTGLVLGDAVRADATVTFTFAKPGQLIEPGCVYCGNVSVHSIGIPEELADCVKSRIFAVFAGDVSLPRRRPDTHKGDYGRDYIIAGSIGYTGAPVMAAEAALRMGAGLVYLGVPDSIYSIAAIKCTEVMPMPLPCDEDGLVSWSAREPVSEMLEKADVCLVGPGLGRSYQLDYLIAHIIQKSAISVVLDADGINAIAGNIDILKQSSLPVVLTPHLGEFARLGGDLSSGRIQAASDFAQNNSCILVLKGHRTITALPDGRVFINTTGGPAMAKGGSGDVLAGMTAALIGQGIPAERACITAVYLHGLAGDICAGELGEYSVTATDIIGAIPKAVKSIMR